MEVVKLGGKLDGLEGIITSDDKGNIIIADVKTAKELSQQGYVYSFTDDEHNQVFVRKNKYAILCL